jgi:hypothetical protein
LGFQPLQTAAAPLSWQALLDTHRRISMAEAAATRVRMVLVVFILSAKRSCLGDVEEGRLLMQLRFWRISSDLIYTGSI